jgi:hypothetical protein
MEESMVRLHLTDRQVSVATSSLAAVVVGTSGQMSYETMAVLEVICQQAGLDSRGLLKGYEDQMNIVRPRKWWKR